MICSYCQHSNPSEDHRCERCGRRLSATAAPDTWQDGALALAYADAVEEKPVPVPIRVLDGGESAASRIGRTPPPRQQMLFVDPDPPKVVEFPTIDPPPRPRRQASAVRQRRRSDVDETVQPYLDFFPPVENAPRTLQTSVEAVIYSDDPVATPQHRALGALLDLSLVLIAAGVFVGTFQICGGDMSAVWSHAPLFAASFVLVGLFYALLGPLCNSESIGSRAVGLRLVTFEGERPGRRERFLRLGSASFGLASAGLGILWALADEENLAWQDHMSRTFPTVRD